MRFSVIVHMFDKINDRITGLGGNLGEEPKHHEREQAAINTSLCTARLSAHEHTQHAARPRPASVCLNIPRIRHAGMLTSLCTIVNVCLSPPPFLPDHIVSAT